LFWLTLVSSSAGLLTMKNAESPFLAVIHVLIYVSVVLTIVTRSEGGR
jgi:hypothetical protein